MDLTNNIKKIDDSMYFESDIEEIIIPDDIEELGERAFASCHNLKRVIIPNSVKSIGKEAFKDCVSLEEIELPDSITFLDDEVFSNCRNLKRIKLPSNITRLPNGFFKNCKKLDIVLEGNIRSLGDEVFMGCESLTNFPSNVKEFGKRCFKHCHKLEKAILNSDVNILPDDMFDDCTNLIDVIYDGTNKIICGSRCFRNCTSLSDIPRFITTLSNGMFEGCLGLEEVTLNTRYIPYNCFRNCTNLKRINNSDMIYEIGSDAFSGCKSLEYISIPNVQKIKPGVFRNCRNLKGIELCKYLTSIGKEAFMNCYLLEDFKLPDTVSKIDKRALKHCHSIKSITIPGALTRIYDDSFSHMYSLERIDVSPFNKRFKTPDHISLICEDVQRFILYAAGAKNKSYSLTDYCLDEYDGKALIRPITYIGPYAFAGAKNLEELTLCTCVNDLECNSFEGCPNLKKLVIEDIELFSCHGFKLREKGRYYFPDMSKYDLNIPFEEVEYKGNIVAVMQDALPFFKNVSKITLSNEGSYPIYDRAYIGCPKITDVTIPDNTKSIGKNAFPKGATLTFTNGLVLTGLVELTYNDDYHGKYKLYRLDDGTYYIEDEKDILKLCKREIDEAVTHSDEIRENPVLFLDFFNDLREHGFHNKLFYNGILMAHMSLKNRDILFDRIDSNDEFTIGVLRESNLFEKNDEITRYLLDANNFTQVVDIIDILKKYNVRDKELYHKYFMRYMGVKSFEKLLSLDRNLLLNVLKTSKIFECDNKDLIYEFFSGNKLERFIRLIKKYNIKSSIIINPAFVALVDNPLFEKMLSVFNANIKRVVSESGIIENISTAKQNLADLLILMDVTGALEKDEITSQRASTFIVEKMFMKKLPNGNMNRYRVIGDDIHRVFNFRLLRDELDLEFANFFLENYPELIENERKKAGFIERVYLNFREISKTSTSDKGSQRKLKVTIDKCIGYLSNVKFDGVNRTNQELADLISAWYDSNDVWMRAQMILAESYKAPRNIFTKIERDEDGKIIYDYDSRNDLRERVSEDYSYEWLPKQDIQNLVLGKYCNCCAHVSGAGQGIMRASMILDNVQNLVIRNAFGEIIAKSTLYVNRRKGYAVFNNVESSINFRDSESILKIYKAFMRGARAFVIAYNMNNEIPITEMTIGASRNTILTHLTNDKHPSTSIHQSLEYGDYSLENYRYAGDWKNAQRLVLKS